jgi:heme-degrading monooxygenase HmoA
MASASSFDEFLSESEAEEMEEQYVWMTTRRLRPGSRSDFERAWTPRAFPDGMLRAYELWSEEDDEIVGVSVWTSREACERYRSSDVEAERRQAMAPFVVDETTATYTGRELSIPNR